MIVKVEDIVKQYGELTAVNDITFRIGEGDFVTLLGPSGCGKTTTLQIIAGLLDPTEGTVYIRGEDVTNKPPDKRNIGMAFQNTALFPHMSVRENISYGLKMRNKDENIEERVEECLHLVDLPEHGDHKPNELSGGQQQRVSLARAIAYEPDILLLDEPLTGLDRVLREDMRKWLKNLQEELGITMLYVTHDQADAMSMSDEIIVLKGGEIQQQGDRKTIYERPKNKFTAEFVGKSTNIAGKVRDTGEQLIFDNEVAPLELDEQWSHLIESNHSDVFIRPEDIHIKEISGGIRTPNSFTGEVMQILDLGDHSQITVRVNGKKDFLVHAERFPSISKGDDIQILIPKNKIIVV